MNKLFTILFVCFLCSNWSFGQLGSTVGSVETFNSSGTLTIPANVTMIKIEAWGAGGGSAGGATKNRAGGGGGAYFTDSYTVTPGATFAITVGLGGDSADGGATTFDVDPGISVGGGIRGVNTAGAGGTVSGGTGISGGAGGARGGTTTGGGGGGSGPINANDGVGGASGGSGGADGGGDGGAYEEGGSDGVSPGGGAGGKGDDTNAINTYLSKGGDGQVKVTVEAVLPPNNDCVDASVLATNVPGSLVNQTLSGANASGLGAESCDAGSTPTPSDVWYTINTDGDGGVLTVTVVPGTNSDVVVSIYDACGGLQVACGDSGLNGAAEVVTLSMANVKGSKGGSSTRSADYLVRVYEKVPSGEDFSIEASGSALPIVLGSFDAKSEKSGNIVLWSTLSEINSDYVEVQSSPNGSTRWETIGKVETTGESLSRIDYELFDNNPYSITYYRLNAMDKDGRSEMSHSINIRRDDKMRQMSLSPNPTSSRISLQTVSDADMIGTIVIHDLTGKIVKNEIINLKNGLNTYSIDLDNLNTGIYLFSLRTEDGVQVEKIVKQ